MQLKKNNQLKDRVGFTLIELLVVVGILGLIAVAALVALNPAEGQRKARDAKRARDVATLQSAVDQFLNDGNTASGSCTTAAGCSSTTTVSCSAGWSSLNLCTYLNALPSDPVNGTSRSLVGGATTGTAVYRIKVDTTTNTYEVDAIQESASNANRAAQDGGNDTGRIEAGTDTGLDLL